MATWCVEGTFPNRRWVLESARVFRRYYGMTPGEYVRRLRLEWALERIQRTAVPLASIALECGFADQSHLTRAFRQRFGLASSRFRRKPRPTRTAGS